MYMQEISHLLYTLIKANSDLCVLIVEVVKALDGNILLPECPDGGQTLKGGGDVRVNWTASCKQRKKE